MRITKASFVYNILLNFAVTSMLTITAQFLTNGDFIITVPDVFIGFAISYPIALAIGFFIPLVRIGKWFTALFGVKNDTYTHNVAYRCSATFIASLIYSLILSPLSYFINRLIYAPGYPAVQFVIDCLRTIPVMVAVGFISSLFFDIPVYKLAHKIDPNF